MKTTKKKRKSDSERELQILSDLSPTTDNMPTEISRPADRKVERFLKDEIYKLHSENLELRLRLKIHGLS